MSISGSAASSGQTAGLRCVAQGEGRGRGDSKERKEERGERKKESPSSGTDLGNKFTSHNPIDNTCVQGPSQVSPQRAGEKALYGPKVLSCSFHQHKGIDISPSPAIHMMHSAYKLNKQGDNIQP